MKLPPLLIFVSSYLGVTWGIYRVFDGVGKTLRKKTRGDLAIWLMGVDLPENLPNWPSMFAVLFDRVFTEKHLSWRCFLRSSIASVAAVVVISWTMRVADVPVFEFMGISILSNVFYLISIALFVNLLPDYLSLYETRLVLGFMAKSGGGLRTMALLVFDLAATVLISFVVGFGVMMPLFFGEFVFSVKASATLFWQGFTLSGDLSFFGVFVYSTFLTSVWLWLYALSGFLVKAIATTRTGLHFLQRHLNVEEHPLRSMGFVLMLLVTVVYVVWGAALVL